MRMSHITVVSPGPNHVGVRRRRRYPARGLTYLAEGYFGNSRVTENRMPQNGAPTGCTLQVIDQDPGSPRCSLFQHNGGGTGAPSVGTDPVVRRGRIQQYQSRTHDQSADRLRRGKEKALHDFAKAADPGGLDMNRRRLRPCHRAAGRPHRNHGEQRSHAGRLPR
jgi:hypothetical protein